MKKITNENMFEIISYLEKELKNNDYVIIEILNPSIKDDIYAGEKLIIDNQEFIYRSFKSWSDLAEILFCKLLIVGLQENKVQIKFQKLNKTESFHNDVNDEKNEKYGEDSTFFRINKNEEPSFLYAYMNALINVKIEEKKEILNLGINKADEFEVIKNLLDEETLNQYTYVIKKACYTRSSIAAILRMFNNCLPLGCSYETSAEDMYANLLYNQLQEVNKKENLSDDSTK